MKIATQNRLAHYQVEYNEICEQNVVLNNQLLLQQQEFNNLQRYLNCNQGDARARQQLRKCSRDLCSTQTKLRQNNIRLGTLTRQIDVERRKIMTGR